MKVLRALFAFMSEEEFLVQARLLEKYARFMTVRDLAYYYCALIQSVH